MWLEATVVICGLIVLIIIFYPRPKQKKPDVASTRNSRPRGT